MFNSFRDVQRIVFHNSNLRILAMPKRINGLRGEGFAKQRVIGQKIKTNKHSQKKDETKTQFSQQTNKKQQRTKFGNQNECQKRWDFDHRVNRIPRKIGQEEPSNVETQRPNFLESFTT